MRGFNEQNLVTQKIKVQEINNFISVGADNLKNMGRQIKIKKGVSI